MRVWFSGRMRHPQVETGVRCGKGNPLTGAAPQDLLRDLSSEAMEDIQKVYRSCKDRFSLVKRIEQMI